MLWQRAKPAGELLIINNIVGPIVLVCPQHIALRDMGMQVAANYAGNDEAAQKFKGETGIPVVISDALRRHARTSIPSVLVTRNLESGDTARSVG